MADGPQIYTRARKIIPVVYHERILSFLEQIEPLADEFLEDNPGCIVEIGSGALYYASLLRAALASKGRDISYTTFDKQSRHVYREPIKGRKIIGVDDAISSGNAYRAFEDVFNPLSEEGYILDWKYAVENNLLFGQGNFKNVWSVRSEPTDVQEMRELSLGSVIRDTGKLIVGFFTRNGH